MPSLDAHFLPDSVDPARLAGSRAVVIDVLRATTTTMTALAAGARAVVPCLTIDDARARSAEFPPGEAILGGERGGLPIDGFDLGNSPAEYTAAAVSGRTVVLTTTNGTKALLHCRSASAILIGGFVNLSALCDDLLADRAGDVHLVCAGTESRVSRDDVLLAGAIAARLAAADSSRWRLDDRAAIARDAWTAVAGVATGRALAARLAAALAESRGGRNLAALGMAADIVLAAEVDRLAVVPRFDADSGRIELR